MTNRIGRTSNDGQPELDIYRHTVGFYRYHDGDNIFNGIHLAKQNIFPRITYPVSMGLMHVAGKADNSCLLSCSTEE